MKRLTVLIHLLCFGLFSAFADSPYFKISVQESKVEACPCNCNKDNDLQVLKDLYNNNGGANWIFPANAVYHDLLDNGQFKTVPNAGASWNINAPNAKNKMGEWHGVVTNQFGCVTDLILWTGPYNVNNPFNFAPLGIGLTGSLPESIGQLCALERLMIPHNNLTNSIPSSIEDLCSLEVLLLHNNDMSGPLPSQIGSLDNLLHLGLHYNDFSGPLPSSITNLDQLVILHLKDNNLSGSIPTNIGDLGNILLMDLSDNCLEGTVPSSIASVGSTSLNGGAFLGRVFAIWLQNNKLDSLPNISNIQIASDGILNVSGNHLTFDDILPNINVLTKYDNQTIDLNLSYCTQVNDPLIIRPGFDQGVDAGNFGFLSTYIWSRPGTSFRDTSTLNVIDFGQVHNLSSGTFSITVTNPLAPDLNLIVNNLVVEVVQKAAILGPTNICSNTVENYSVLNGSNGYDYTVTGGSIISSDASNITVQWGTGLVGEICATKQGTCNPTNCLAVTIAPTIDISISAPDTLNCSQAAVTLMGSSNLTDLSFAWLTDQGNLIDSGPDTLEITTPGNYILEATNDLKCIGRDTVSVFEKIDDFQVSITGETIFCEDGNTTLEVSPNFNDYNWSTGSRSNSIQVSNSGQFQVTVTNSNNCTATSTINVQSIAVPSATITKSGDLDCSNNEVQLFNNTINNTIQSEWRDENGNVIGSDNVITITTPGTYSLVVTNENGCTNRGQIEVIKDESVVIPLISGTIALCEGTTGQLTVAENYATYLWSTGATTATIPIDNSQSNYAVTVTDVSGCSGSNNVNITLQSPPSVSIVGQTEICPGSSTTLLVPNTFSDYNWSNGANGFETIIDSPGSYSVTVTDGNGCTNQASIQIVESTPITTTIIGADNFCIGSSTSLRVDQVPNATYLWSTGETSPLILTSNEGIYSVTITDANNCTGTDNITVTESTPPEVSILGQNTICANGSTILQVFQTYSDYAWSNGASAQSITVSEPGTYTVTISDQSNCTNTASIEVVERPNLSPPIVGDLSFCGNESVQLSSLNNYAFYNWSTSADTKDIAVNAEGTYSLTVTDNSGCTGISTVEVVAATSPTPQIIGNPNLCLGTATNLTTQVDYESYAWSTSDSLETISVNSAGTYFVTVTNSFGCTGVNSFTIVEAPEIQFNIVGNTAICEESSTTLQSDGAYLTYKWSTGENTAEIIVNEVGTYALTVTDLSGCTGNASVEVTENSSIFPQIVGTSTICGGTPSEISMDADYASYTWSNGATTKNITVTESATYQVTVSNEAGCTGETSITIDETPALQPTINGDFSFCEGQSTTLSLDQTYSSYLWTGDIVRTTIEVSEAGVYAVTVTDANGCTGATSVEVTKGSLPPPSFSPEAPSFCKGTFETFTSITATPGYANYLWNTGAVGSTILVSEAGLYTVTITDENGCMGVNSVEVVELPTPNVNRESRKVCSDNINETISLFGFEKYIWSTNDTTPEIVVNQVGEYKVTVTNEYGCTNTAAYEVIEIAPPRLVIENSVGKDTVGCSSDKKLFLLDVAYDVDSYRWEDEDGKILSEVPVLNVTKGGTYRVIGTDNATGCETVVERTIVELENTVQVMARDSLLTLDCRNTQATIDVSTSIDTDTYEWQFFIQEGFGKKLDAITTSTHATSDAGQYLVIGINELSACRDSTWIEVIDTSYTVKPEIVGTREFCENATGQLGVLDTYDTYAWTGGGNTQQIEITEAKYYEVTVTDPNGCTGVNAINVQTTSPKKLELGLQRNDMEVCEGAGTEIDLRVLNNSGTGPFNIILSDGQEDLTFTNISMNQGIMVFPTSTSNYSIVEAEDLGNACFIFGDISNELSFTINPLPQANSIEEKSCSEQDEIGASFDLNKYVNKVKDNPSSSVRWYRDSSGTQPINTSNSFSTSSNASTIFATINNGVCDSKPVPISLLAGNCAPELKFEIEIGTDLDLSERLPGESREVYITNRWGDLVYSSQDYEGLGAKFNGSNLPQGAYYIYVVNKEQEDDLQVPYKGIIYLLK